MAGRDLSSLKDSWDIQCKSSKLVDSRNKMRSFLDNVRMDEVQKSRMILCTDEAAANIVEHSSSSKKETEETIKFNVEANSEEGVFHVSITDKGAPFDPTQQKKVDMKEHLLSGKKGGLGIHIMRTQLDIFEYKFENKCNVLTLGMKIEE